MPASIDVVIVNYNTRELLRACIDEVCAQGPASVTVVDNASTDGSVRMMRRRYQCVRLLANRENRGYGAGVNEGLAAVANELALVLNADAVPRPGALAALEAAARAQPQAALIAPRLVLASGETQRSVFPFPGTRAWLLENDPIGSLIRLMPGLRGRFQRFMAADRARDVPWAVGAALLLRRDAVLGVGGFDESYFMYFEEVDLAFRLAAAGWRVRYEPAAVVAHAGGASTSQCRTAMLVQHYASTIRFYEEHCTPRSRDRWLRIMRLKMALRLGRDLARLPLTRGADERRVIEEQIAAWRIALGGRAPEAAGAARAIPRPSAV